MRRPISSKSDSCTEGAGVYAAGISGKVCAHYPGRSVRLPLATAAERRRDGRAEVSRRHSSSIDRSEGPNVKSGERARISLMKGDADIKGERP